MDKDNKILSFEDLKKKKENIEKEFKNGKIEKSQINSLLGQLTDDDKEQIKALMETFGFGMEDTMKSQMDKILNAKSIDDLIENASSDFFNPGILGKISEEAKKANEKFKVEYKHYRSFSQWLTVYRPYTMEKFLFIEQVEDIIREMNLTADGHQSKNQLISLIGSSLKLYVEKHLEKFDEERMNLLGHIIANRGVWYLSEPLSDFEEKQIDYLSRLGFVFRVNESGKKALVTPQEILDVMMEINFKNFLSTQKINSIICNSICGMANLYGVIPRVEGSDICWHLVEEEKFFESKSDYELYFDKIVSECFPTSIVSKAYYTNAAVNSDYIFHPMVGFVEEFYKSQSSSQHKYKNFTYDEFRMEGKEGYYQDSIQMNAIWDILREGNLEEDASTKALIYTFSKMEFEPQLIIALLETMFEIPTGSKYEILLDSLRGIAKRTAKWVLKGYSLGEDTEEGKTIKSESYDPSKIINLDFHKK